jgi:hypothetical protein
MKVVVLVLGGGVSLAALLVLPALALRFALRFFTPPARNRTARLQMVEPLRCPTPTVQAR